MSSLLVAYDIHGRSLDSCYPKKPSCAGVRRSNLGKEIIPLIYLFPCVDALLFPDIGLPETSFHQVHAFDLMCDVDGNTCVMQDIDVENHPYMKNGIGTKES